MTALPDPSGFPRRGTLEEYFRIEEESKEHRYEYRSGLIVCMPGGSERHALIPANIIAAVGVQLRGGPCRIYTEALRIGVRRKTYYMYPDLSVVCGPCEFDPRDRTNRTVLNPRLVVEVLSPSTEAYDRGEKFERYLQIDTLQEYVLVAQGRPRVESYLRQADGAWSFTFVDGVDATLRLRSLNVDLPLAEAYAGVTLPPPAPDDVGEIHEV